MNRSLKPNSDLQAPSSLEAWLKEDFGECSTGECRGQAFMFGKCQTCWKLAREYDARELDRLLGISLPSLPAPQATGLNRSRFAALPGRNYMGLGPAPVRIPLPAWVPSALALLGMFVYYPQARLASARLVARQ
jgi:hypothetical protein